MSHLTSSCLHLIANVEVLLVAFKQTAGIPLCGMERNSSHLLKRKNLDSYWYKANRVKKSTSATVWKLNTTGESYGLFLRFQQQKQPVLILPADHSPSHSQCFAQLCREQGGSWQRDAPIDLTSFMTSTEMTRQLPWFCAPCPDRASGSLAATISLLWWGTSSLSFVFHAHKTRITIAPLNTKPSW